jgi:hypothetical protein
VRSASGIAHLTYHLLITLLSLHHRVNHGLAHAIRKAVLVRNVASVCMDNFVERSNRKLFDFNEAQLQAMEIAMIFEVCGRESEVGYNDDRLVYKSYHETSCKVFDTFARKVGMSDDVREEALEALHKLYQDGGAMTRVFEYCHEMDMLRCSDAAIMHPKIDRLAETVCAPRMSSLECVFACPDVARARRLTRRGTLLGVASSGGSNIMVLRRARTGVWSRTRR